MLVVRTICRVWPHSAGFEPLIRSGKECLDRASWRSGWDSETRYRRGPRRAGLRNFGRYSGCRDAGDHRPKRHVAHASVRPFAPRIGTFGAESRRSSDRKAVAWRLRKFAAKSKTVAIDEIPSMRHMSQICALLGFESDAFRARIRRFCGRSRARIGRVPKAPREQRLTCSIHVTKV